jgi:hypothetical protein
MDWTDHYYEFRRAYTMPKQMFPYDLHGHKADNPPWAWQWNVPRSKGTGTPYRVSVRRMTHLMNNEVIWGCDCAAGKNGSPSCQHRMRVQYDLVTQQDMLRNLPEHVREIAAPNVQVVTVRALFGVSLNNASGSKVVAYDTAGRRNLKAVF